MLVALGLPLGSVAGVESAAALANARLAGAEDGGAGARGVPADAAGFGEGRALGAFFSGGVLRGATLSAFAGSLARVGELVSEGGLSSGLCSGSAGATGVTGGGELAALGSFATVPTSTLLAAQVSFSGGGGGRVGVALERADQAATSSA